MHSVAAEFIKSFMIILMASAGFVAIVLGIIRSSKGKHPCEWGSLKIEKVERDIKQIDLHFNNRCGGLKTSLDKHRDAHERALRESNECVKTELKELRVEIRDEMRRIAESSAAGDLGLAQLSKDLVNAIAEIKDVTKGTNHG